MEGRGMEEKVRQANGGEGKAGERMKREGRGMEEKGWQGNRGEGKASERKGREDKRVGRESELRARERKGRGREGKTGKGMWRRWGGGEEGKEKKVEVEKG